MKLCKIYSSDSNRFHNIKFNKGFNVIIAEITNRSEEKKDTHNLGKTLLIHLIDYLLLKKVDNKKAFFLTRGGFEGLLFFLEIELSSGSYLIIRRGVDTPSKISFKATFKESSEFITEYEWDEENLPFEKAKDFLNQKLRFDVVSQWNYRQSVTYFLRTQNDFKDVFQLDKFSKGKHESWKPFTFSLLGFDGKLLEEKYKLEEEQNDLTEKLKELEKDANLKESQRDIIRGQISIKRDEKDKIETAIDHFNFYEKDKNINKDLIDNIDNEIQTLNTYRYGLSCELDKIEKSLKCKDDSINFDKLKQLYKDVELYFPDSLEKNFKTLINFNKAITEQRNEMLQENRIKLQKELDPVEEKLRELEKQKEQALSYLTEKDSYQKFKQNQKSLARLEADIITLEERLTKMSSYKEEIERSKSKISEQIKTIDKEVEQEKHSEIRKKFNSIIREILDRNAVISVPKNKEDNIEFRADIQNPASGITTDESAGHTYKKFMCMAFDLSLLVIYSKRAFYHFAYHDGALEALDDRKKIIYLELVRNLCREYNLQYIITLIDSELPLDNFSKRISFPDAEICLRLHDRDDSGKLFKKSF